MRGGSYVAVVAFSSEDISDISSGFADSGQYATPTKPILAPTLKGLDDSVSIGVLSFIAGTIALWDLKPTRTSDWDVPTSSFTSPFQSPVPNVQVKVSQRDLTDGSDEVEVS